MLEKILKNIKYILSRKFYNYTKKYFTYLTKYFNISVLKILETCQTIFDNGYMSYFTNSYYNKTCKLKMNLYSNLI
jgi:hypothetical protein